MDRLTETTDATAPRDREAALREIPTAGLKFKALYIRDLATGLGLLDDGTLVRFIYEGPRGSGNTFTLRVYGVEVKDERSASPSMFNPA
jgi:hypothetical protein